MVAHRGHQQVIKPNWFWWFFCYCLKESMINICGSNLRIKIWSIPRWKFEWDTEFEKTLPCLSMADHCGGVGLKVWLIALVVLNIPLGFWTKHSLNSILLFYGKWKSYQKAYSTNNGSYWWRFSTLDGWRYQTKISSFEEPGTWDYDWKIGGNQILDM